ncbi:hypothetical protein S58_25850 [Bradyrhizobium oligotrophicum S58]|uniref:Uncharacterized protein n=1 Tax=Bradyrhizobium oligotrophicum S58 TaxID=1245469 RepID=M4Z6D6_9BRAD|nr:hypothetical protein S58_25850 [Bradyrhizobium oligotrophicum S58]
MRHVIAAAVPNPARQAFVVEAVIMITVLAMADSVEEVITSYPEGFVLIEIKEPIEKI